MFSCFCSDDDVVVGLDNTFYPDPLVISPYCGQYVSITDVDSGSRYVSLGSLQLFRCIFSNVSPRSVTALVADASGKEYTTLSIAAFRQLAPLSTGQLTIEWHFLADGANATSSYPSNSTSLYGNSTVSGNSTVKATVAATTVRVAVATDVATATTTTTTKDDSAAKASSAALAAVRCSFRLCDALRRDFVADFKSRASRNAGFQGCCCQGRC